MTYAALASRARHAGVHALTRKPAASCRRRGRCAALCCAVLRRCAAYVRCGRRGGAAGLQKAQIHALQRVAALLQRTGGALCGVVPPARRGGVPPHAPPRVGTRLGSH